MSARLAKEIAEHIEEATNASRNGARDTSFFELKVAGVKATLYAAEQQRIANLQSFADGLASELHRAQENPDSHPGFATLETIGALVLEGLDI